MKRLILILLLIKINFLFCQTDSINNISTFSNYHIISIDNYILFNSLVNANSNEFKTKYRKEILILLDSIINSSNLEKDSILVKITKQKILNKRSLSKNQKKHLLQLIFSMLTLKDSFRYNERSSIESDYFFDTCTYFNNILATEKFSKMAFSNRKYGFFSFVKFPPKVEIISIRSGFNFLVNNNQFDSDYYSSKYNHELNLRLRRIIGYLNKNYILIKVNKQL